MMVYELTKPSVFYYLPIVYCNLIPIKLLFYYYYITYKLNSLLIDYAWVVSLKMSTSTDTQHRTKLLK